MEALTGRLQFWDGVVIAIYIAAVVTVGLLAGRLTKSTHDFFLAGQRFRWWLVAVSCVAALVGSYSFQQYSQIGYKYGFCSMMPYTNEWFVLPLFLLGWLPIIYYSRVSSIPEYFERRFDRRTRTAVLLVLLVYLEVYIGINLVTIGLLFNSICPVDLVSGLKDVPVLAHAASFISEEDAGVLFWAALMAVLSAFYMYLGGQNSVIITDLLQAFTLLTVGIALFVFGVFHLGGWTPFWNGLPVEHRVPFAPFNHPPGLNAVGDFWSDGVVGTFAFYMINQGILMRFLSAKSVAEGRRAMFFVVLVLMPIAAVAVSGAGWVGRSMRTEGIVKPLAPSSASTTAAGATIMPSMTAAQEQKAEQDLSTNIFVVVARTICTKPGMFGLVMAAVIAALMSTLDTYITAFSAIAVNDIWRPLQPGRNDRYYLSIARFTAIIATLLGMGMVPILHSFDSIYQALSFFTSAINPPLIVVVGLGICWTKFSARAAFWTIAFGSLAMVGSLFKPELILPFSHGDVITDGFPYLRALFGLVVSFPLGIAITLFDRSSYVRLPAARVAFWCVLLVGMTAIYLAVPHQRAVADQPVADAAMIEGQAAPSETIAASASSPVAWAVGLLAAFVTAVAIAFLDRGEAKLAPEGLTMATLAVHRQHAVDRTFRSLTLPLAAFDSTSSGEQDEAQVRLGPATLAELSLEPGDSAYVCDARWWMGGIRGLHATLGPVAESDDAVYVNQAALERGHLLLSQAARVEPSD